MSVARQQVRQKRKSLEASNKQPQQVSNGNNDVGADLKPNNRPSAMVTTERNLSESLAALLPYIPADDHANKNLTGNMLLEPIPIEEQQMPHTLLPQQCSSFGMVSQEQNPTCQVSFPREIRRSHQSHLQRLLCQQDPNCQLLFYLQLLHIHS